MINLYVLVNSKLIMNFILIEINPMIDL